MNLFGISINHRTAPVNLREEVFLSDEEIHGIIRKAKDNFFKEGLVISTCNRTEIYGVPVNSAFDHNSLPKFLFDYKPAKELTSEHFQFFASKEAIRHLLRVATGIDSLLIGDNQIFKQVKDSFLAAEENEFAGFIMKRIFDTAIRTGKRAITETRISEGAVTVSYAAVQLIEKIFSNLHKKSALVIGTGETGEIAAKHLRDRGIGRLALTNRTFEKAEKLANELNTAVFPFNSFKDHLHKFDIVISATSSEELLIKKEDVQKAMKLRNSDSVVLMDIAIPRDIDPETKSIENVFYHDIDSLNIIVEQNLAKRRDEIPRVEKIIDEEVEAFFEWHNSLQAAPTIKTLRDYFEEIRADEVSKNINKFSEDDKEKLEIITKRIINKILHQPTTELRKVSENNQSLNESAEKISVIRNLFGLDKLNKEDKTKQ